MECFGVEVCKCLGELLVAAIVTATKGINWHVFGFSDGNFLIWGEDSVAQVVAQDKKDFVWEPEIRTL